MFDGQQEDAGPRSGVLERVTLIMDCLGEAPGHLMLEDVAGITGLPRSTTFRLLRQLADLGWVGHEAEGYVLGPRLAYRGVLADFDGLRAAASPVLSELAGKTGCVAHLGIMHGGFVDYVDRIGAGAESSVPTRIGTRIFAPESTSGMAMLSWLAPQEVDAVIDHAGANRSGGRDVLHRDLGIVRRRGGVAYRDGSGGASGVSSVGAAILGPEGPVGAVSVARRGSIPLQSVGPLVRRAADAITAALHDSTAGSERL
ncbi:helix-turn-helix domain-containing protein [Arthrobacter sp. zg-Y820]|uniref:IclR family transcriptional regulator n=1 Tax=unclassified Arthrobacter TaxID=235627 RepID=UPI001E41476F|nr:MULTISPECIES: helix-turn-helix domain-containing protein [unclassified Arthrobacter]MCC9196834.1 helix-turn-helix domain-containing protein [Arthrobacter sp. zg-Y820]MDK1279697.1 helix-turn-helix domain-containing protein [Arthrobacter sp. zg.Y820]WIB07934.1 helix-turn-helix domain-containing protein [Arthrobacter sp. zg-Y820]